MNEKDAGGLRQRGGHCGSRGGCRVERELPAVPLGPDYSCGADQPLPLPSLLPKKPQQGRFLTVQVSQGWPLFTEPTWEGYARTRVSL